MDIYKCPNPENRLATQNTKNKKNMKNRDFSMCDHNALIFDFLKIGCDDNYFLLFFNVFIQKGFRGFLC